MYFYEILQSIMDKKKLTVADVARLSGLTDSTVRSMITRKNKTVSLEVAFKISKGLHVSLQHLNGEDDLQTDEGSCYTLQEQEHIKKYRVIDNTGRSHVDCVLDWELNRISELEQADSDYISKQVARSRRAVDFPTRAVRYYRPAPGANKYLWDNFVLDEINIPDTEDNKDCDFVISIDGDSMEPLFWDTDMVLVQSTDQIKLEEIGVFTLDGKCLIKELGNNRLISTNPKYPPILFTENSNIQCKGKVIGNLMTHTEEDINYMIERRHFIEEYRKVYPIVAEKGLDDNEETHKIVEKTLEILKETPNDERQ